ncbi:MAG TPA: amidohydrolase [Thermoplasmatales archaeon]|nr:amidohydrolase [Candidatus Thermoplasmatota archaeon]MDD5779337.1 amidohydrolase [Candidatus Thermoplasmatota archaeon]HDS59785.1 amidohydrolase [Thermoplasmatales archaeon]
MSILIRDALVLTQDAERSIARKDVFIEDGRIAEVSPRVPVEASYVITGRNLVMPGLVNTHTHLPMTLMRGYGDDLPLEQWLTQKIWPVEQRLTADLVAAGTRLALLEMVASGTTCVADMYFFEDTTARICREMGMRAFPGFSIIDFDTAEMAAEEMIPACEAFLRQWRRDDLISPVVAPHSTYSCSPETLSAAAELARRYDVYLHTHCSETRQEVYEVVERYGCRPLEQLEKTGALSDKTILAHCGWITKEEVRTIARAGACVSHNPVSNMKLATGGYTPLPELLAAGATVTLGTDGAASNNTLDLLESMKYAALIHKHHRWDATVAGAQQVLDMATVSAARFLGLSATVTEGAAADLAVIDLDAPGLVPLHDPVSQVVYAAQGGHVSSTIINGKPVMLERAFPLFDAQAVMDHARQAAHQLVDGRRYF